MTNQLASFIAAHTPALEAALAEWLPLGDRAGAESLNAALRYAVFPGGKRFRPMLTLIGARLVGASALEVMPAACAIEFLHTSSLILDDLPAMDDADLRRGRATTHLVFGESLAMLAALALFNQAYGLLALAAAQGNAPQRTATLIAEAARCIGADGMIGGQAVDLIERTATVNADMVSADVSASRNLKTTALMRLTMTAGAIAGGASPDDVAALARFGECLGAAYQIGDDLLDELSDSRATGKTARQDARHLRTTFVLELGINGARRHALALIEETRAAIRERFGCEQDARLLIQAAEVVMRDTGKLGRLAHSAA